MAKTKKQQEGNAEEKPKAAAEPKKKPKAAKALFSINVQFSIFIGSLLFVLLLLVTAIVRNQLRQDLGKEVAERGETVARNLSAPAADALLANDPLVYAQLVKDVIEEGYVFQEANSMIEQIRQDLFAAKAATKKNEGIYKAIIVDKDGVIASESGKDLLEIGGKKYTPPADIHQGPDDPFPVFKDERGHPVYDIRTSLEQEGKPVGEIHIYMRENVISDTVRIATTKLVAIMLISLLAGIAVLSLIVRVLMSPIKHLVRGVNAVAAGDFSKTVKRSPRDELGELVDAFNGMTKSLHEKEAVQEALAKYTSKDLVNQMLTDKSKLELGGQRVHPSIFFSVLHGMAALASTIEPEKFVGVMNEYLEIETDIIMKNGGSIDKFIGDEVMALWGLQKDDDISENAYRCVKTAVEIQDAITKHNAMREAKGEPTFECSIGINTGEVVSGNMGSSVKMDYTVLGGNVNLAARLGLVAARGGQTIISQSTYSQVAERFKIDKLAPMQLKGIKEPVPLYWPRKII